MHGTNGVQTDSQGHPRRIALNRDRVVSAALTLLDEEGLEGLTMRRLGSALGVEAMSLYRHVPNKTALLLLIRKKLLEDMTIEGNVVGWRGLLQGTLRAAFHCLSAHPNASALFHRTSPGEVLPSSELERIDRRLREVGYPEELRQRLFTSVTALLVGMLCQADASEQQFSAALDVLLDGVEQARRRH